MTGYERLIFYQVIDNIKNSRCKYKESHLHSLKFTCDVYIGKVKIDVELWIDYVKYTAASKFRLLTVFVIIDNERIPYSFSAIQKIKKAIKESDLIKDEYLVTVID